MNNVINFIAFQTVWFVTVLGAAHGPSWLGPLVLAGWLPVHFRLSQCPREDFTLLLVALVAGTLIDSVYRLTGLVDYAGFAVMPEMAPLWISTLWVNFALAINHSLYWLRGRLRSAVVFGAIGGPLSYLAGESLGAIEILDPRWMGLAAMALVWAIATPVLANLGRFMDDTPVSR